MGGEVLGRAGRRRGADAGGPVLQVEVDVSVGAQGRWRHQAVLELCAHAGGVSGLLVLVVVVVLAEDGGCGDLERLRLGERELVGRGQEGRAVSGGVF